MDTKVFEKYESAVRSYCRRFPTVFNKAKGSYFYDENGDKYLDFFCCAGALNYGHNNPEIKQKVVDYIMEDGITHSLDMYTVAKREFIEFFEESLLQPRGLDYKVMFTGPTGTNSVEAAIKLARKVKGRNQIWAFMGAFHGMTLGALALTTDKGSRGGAGVPLDYVTHIPAPYMFEGFDVINYMQTLLDDDHSATEKPAAIIIETVQTEGGIQVFSVDFLKAIRKFCDDNDILLIVDDIQVGCARTGTFFSFERANIVPDMVTLSKSIGGYGFPFALTLFKPELDIWKAGEHNGTFRGNQIAIIAAKAGLEFMLNNNVEAETRRKGELESKFIEEEILPLDSRLSYRGIGLVYGIDFINMPDDKFCAKVQQKCFDNKLIIEVAGRKDSVLKTMPPLTISDDELLTGLNILKDAIKQTIAEM